MKIPGWLVALLAVALMGAAGLWGLFALAANSVESGVGAGVLGVLSVWMMVRAVQSRPSSATASVTVEVPPAVRLGAEFPVRAKLRLDTRLPLNPHRQRLRFVIEEQWLWGNDTDDVAPRAVVHEEVLQVHAPLDVVGEWETTLTLHVPRNAPTSFQTTRFRLHAWVEFSLPYGMFGELQARQPVVIVSEVAP